MKQSKPGLEWEQKARFYLAKLSPQLRKEVEASYIRKGWLPPHK